VQRGDYEEYARRFNARDYAGVFAFYADSPSISFFGIEIGSLEELKDFYGFLHAYVDERVTVERFAASDELLAIEATVRIEAHRDLPTALLEARGLGQFHAMRTGDVFEMRQMIHYHVAGGKFTAVRCALLPP
jgi:hypothetical protein